MKKLIIFGGLLMALTTTVNIDAHAQESKGISKQGKGAIIGGAGGAVVGGLIGKNVGGALIGGAIGAGGGYVIGNEARKREEKRKRAAYLQRRANWKRAHPGRAYPY
ncbi:glycine zipper domain-containing protein [Mucilaginibacter glaciei]|uniref:Glycine zipper 2TM domain-containing protein n=1 Tax=Mucilaginibacter glaciei TaxID=2772109 RepID=A0A926S098_9SPHI|nr:glycine zipper domain-containing protein [Mucilaginibacter glaciei]MBD1392710.1 glycine zipper 2TM domain-containing protein [Mucilaginibacter glaciei]